MKHFAIQTKGPPITTRQKLFYIALAEKAFSHSEEMKNFCFKLIPQLSKYEASREIKKLLERIHSRYSKRINH